MSSNRYSKPGFNSVRIAALVFFTLTISCYSVDKSGGTDYPLGIFNFELDRLAEDEASQIAALQAIGYTGLVMDLRFENQLEILHSYQVAIGDSAFEIYGGYVFVDFDRSIEEQNTHIDNVIASLSKSRGSLCVILRGKEWKREQVVAFLRSSAERTKAAGIELVIFPHIGKVYVIESAEDALPYIEEIQSDNIFVSLHLSHEFLGGNGDRLDEVAAKIMPWIRLPSINGTDVGLQNGFKKLYRGVHIQPLASGDYDSSQLLKALKSANYKGPIILHSWGLEEAPVNHYQTSFKRFQDMKAAL